MTLWSSDAPRPRLRWCPRCRLMGASIKAEMGRRTVRLCASCSSVTQARKPKPPKHQGADRKWSKAVRERSGGQCEACPSRGGDGAHVKPKGAHPKLRHHPDNGIDLCRECHSYFTAHTSAWKEWLRVNRPGLVERLDQAESRSLSLRASFDGAPLKIR